MFTGFALINLYKQVLGRVLDLNFPFFETMRLVPWLSFIQFCIVYERVCHSDAITVCQN